MSTQQSGPKGGAGQGVSPWSPTMNPFATGMMDPNNPYFSVGGGAMRGGDGMSGQLPPGMGFRQTVSTLPPYLQANQNQTGFPGAGAQSMPYTGSGSQTYGYTPGAGPFSPFASGPAANIFGAQGPMPSTGYGSPASGFTPNGQGGPFQSGPAATGNAVIQQDGMSGRQGYGGDGMSGGRIGYSPQAPQYPGQPPPNPFQVGMGMGYDANGRFTFR